MLTEPVIVTRPEQPYAAIVLEVAQPEISRKAPQLIDEVIRWVRSKDGSFAGPPFFNYFEFLPNGRMKMQVGMPTTTLLKPVGRFTTGQLPGGRYASVRHTGPYAELYEANMALDAWVRAQGLELAGEPAGDRMVGATRLEIYHMDPAHAADVPTTEVAFRLRD